jgi:exodeoxyribonuclease VIII
MHYLSRPKDSTPAMEFGKAFHMALLQPKLFSDTYIIAPDVNRRTKAGKDMWEEFIANLKDDAKTVTIEEYNRIQMMIESVMNNSSAADLIANLVESEKMIEWTDEETNVPMRGILDGIGRDYIIDIKTCHDAEPTKFQRDAINMAYHRQAAIYVDSQPRPMSYYLIAIEKDEPFGVSVHEMTAELLNAGRFNYRHLLNEYKGWVEDGCASAGYEFWDFTGIHQFEAPSWIRNS